MLHKPPTNCHLLAAKQEPYQTAYLLTKILKIFLRKVRRMGQKAGKKKEDKIERAMAVGRRTREDILKWNQMTVLRIQTGLVVGG